MTKLKKILRSLGGMLPAVALMMGATTVTQACNWWFHQPKVPNGLKTMVDRENNI